MSAPAEVVPEWVHITHVEASGFREVYGFAGGGQGSVNLEGIRLRPKDRPSNTLIVYMHPASTLPLLPLPRAMVARGAHVLCAGSRYQRNDTPLIMETILRTSWLPPISSEKIATLPTSFLATFIAKLRTRDVLPIEGRAATMMKSPP